LAGTVFEFADFKLDCGRFELLRDGSSIRLERKPLELLVLLVSSEGRLVSRAEIAKRLWDSEVFVDTEHGINTAIRKIRTVLRDDPESPRFIQTVTGMGYRFIAAVTTKAGGLQASAERGKDDTSSEMPGEHGLGAKAPFDLAGVIPGMNPRPTSDRSASEMSGEHGSGATQAADKGLNSNQGSEEPFPQGLKPTHSADVSGTTEVVPFQSLSFSAASEGSVESAFVMPGINPRPTSEVLEGHASGAKALDAAFMIPGINPRPTAPIPEPTAPILGPTAPILEPTARKPGATAGTTPHRIGRAVWLALAAAGIVFATVVVAVGPHTLAARLLGRDAQPTIRSLAVIPLNNLSGDPSQDYFADGMTDELITMLAKDSTLRITSRTSVMQYKGAHRPLPEIARALNVDAILEGSVSRSNNQVHMTLQLIRADTDAHLWAESYDRDANDVALPDEAAQAIAKRLHSVEPSTAAVRYVNPAAHDAYLRGRYLWFTRVEESAAYFRKATEIQPDYAAAWAGLANYYGVEIARGNLDPRTSMAPEEEAAERAVQLDPNLAEAHEAMGGALFLDRWDFAGADRELLRAISLDPRDADLYYLRANLLQATNRFAESIEVEKKAMDLDPFSRPFGMAWIYLGARQYDEALADLRLRMEATPNSPDLLWTVMDICRRKGNTKGEVEAAAKFYLALGQAQTAAKLRLAYERGGARGYILWQLADKLAWAKSHYVSPMALALLHARLGEKELTLALLEEGFRQHSTDILWMQIDPAYDFLHGDPRYRSIVQRIGQPPLY
jgi:TolB-like protein/DNA-binding winged helix-turn-helix (wHTH) protein